MEKIKEIILGIISKYSELRVYQFIGQEFMNQDESGMDFMGFRENYASTDDDTHFYDLGSKLQKEIRDAIVDLMEKDGGWEIIQDDSFILYFENSAKDWVKYQITDHSYYFWVFYSGQY